MNSQLKLQINQICRNIRNIAFLALIYAALVPVIAQGTGRENVINHDYLYYLQQTVIMIWIVVSLIGGYLFSIIFSAIFVNLGYPPNIARLGCWLGAIISLSFVSFYVFGQVVPAQLPIWILITIGVFILLLGVVLYATRRQTSD